MQRQFIRFIVIGVLSTIVNYLFFFILYKYYSVYYILASAIGFLSGVIAGYSLNKSWTFEITTNQDRYFYKYLVVYFTSLLLSVMILKVLVSGFLLSPELANIITIGVTTCTNFLGVKYLVFKS